MVVRQIGVALKLIQLIMFMIMGYKLWLRNLVLLFVKNAFWVAQDLFREAFALHFFSKFTFFRHNKSKRALGNAKIRCF